MRREEEVKEVEVEEEVEEEEEAKVSVVSPAGTFNVHVGGVVG